MNACSQAVKSVHNQRFRGANAASAAPLNPRELYVRPLELPTKPGYPI